MVATSGSMTQALIGLVIVSVIISVLTPIIITNFVNTNTTGWGATETTLYGLLPLFIVLGIFIGVLIYLKLHK